ncbi:MAG: TetR family transcriptional regulator [Desulfobacterales bacterium CG23_combo_of_CG06-09_8_20_14_all_51_8]|nr:MAG: TetR family transcriptional regulator [Desulfobacterales bacterium CG23_combo_of_CG06-09_8_20_14_all_51_8]
MPKLPRSPEEVESIKTAILTTALKLMCDDGFEALSMRKLAGRLKMTAANIYNYYQNKDDLYLAIQTRGFQMLADRFQEIYDSLQPGPDRLYAMMRAYLAFGMEFPDYYEIMFSRNTPKYADYKGTPMEPAATIEKQTALKVADITVRAIRDLYDGKEAISESEALYRTILVWSALHGVVNLLNSRVLPEVVETGDAFMDRLFRDLLKLAVGAENTHAQK